MIATLGNSSKSARAVGTATAVTKSIYASSMMTNVSLGTAATNLRISSTDS